MELHKDCFAYRNPRYCQALSEINCYECAFYKTKKDQKAQLEKLGLNEEGKS